MPFCPDCGLCFASVNSVRMHRASGNCVHAAAGRKASVAVPAPLYSKGRYTLHPNGPQATEQELDQLLALQSAQQEAEVAKREKMLLDQQINLVLPARQAQLQQGQEALKEQVMQLKLNMLAQEQMKAQGSNMEMEYLHNELNAVQDALRQIRVPAPPAQPAPAGGYYHHPLPDQGPAGGQAKKNGSAVRARQQQQQQQVTPRSSKKQAFTAAAAGHHRHKHRSRARRSRQARGHAANGRKQPNKARKTQHNTHRRGRNGEDEDSLSHSSGSEDLYEDEADEMSSTSSSSSDVQDTTSWSTSSGSVSEEDSNSRGTGSRGEDDEDGERDARRYGRAGRRPRPRRGRRDSAGPTTQTARLPTRPAHPSAAATGRKSHTANYAGNGGGRNNNYSTTNKGVELYARAAPPLRPSAAFAEKDEDRPSSRRHGRRYSKALQKLPKPLRHVVQSLREEVAELRAGQLPGGRDAGPPFPTSSALSAGQYKLKLASLSGLDLTVPLEDIELSVKLYYMVNRAGAFMLDPMHEHTFARQPPPFTRQSSTLLLCTTAPVEFTVANDEDLLVAVLQLRYRGQLLYWATVFTRQKGAWTEPLRPPPFDLANALQSPDDVELYLPYVMGGTIEEDRRDVLAQAEDYMQDAALENALVSRVLRGLPPLPPLPPGMALLPGMPGNEGPFLPPQPDAILYNNNTNKASTDSRRVSPMGSTTAAGAAASALPHYSLPPPPGMTILQWNALLRQHLERHAAPSARSGSVSAAPATATPPSRALAPQIQTTTATNATAPAAQTVTVTPPVPRRASATSALPPPPQQVAKPTPAPAAAGTVQPVVVSRVSDASHPPAPTTTSAANTTTTAAAAAASSSLPASPRRVTSGQVSPTVTVLAPPLERRPTTTTTTTTTAAAATSAQEPQSTAAHGAPAAAASPVKTATMSAPAQEHEQPQPRSSPPPPQQQQQQPQQPASPTRTRTPQPSPTPAPTAETSKVRPGSSPNARQAAQGESPATRRQSVAQQPPAHDPQALAAAAAATNIPTTKNAAMAARKRSMQQQGQPPSQQPSPSATPLNPALDVRKQSVQPPVPSSEQPIAETAEGKLPLVDRPLVAQMQLRPVLDNNGSLAVPRGYRSAKNPPSCILLDRFDVNSNVGICVHLGLAKPGDTRPQPPTFAGHGPDKREVNVFFDGVVGVPLDADCVRLLVYCFNSLDAATGKPIHALPDPHSLMRRPDLIAYQDFSSSTANPKFTAKFTTRVEQHTYALVIIEYCVTEKENPLVLGHACLPIHQNAVVGNYAVRVRMGDPRRSHERDPREPRPAEQRIEEQRKAAEQYDQAQLEASVNAQALRNLLPAPPHKRAECVPACFLVWRLESSETSAPYFDLPDQLPLSQQELAILKARSAHAGTPPSVRSIGNVKEAEESFVGRAMLVGDGLSMLVPYSPERGVFVRVEGVRGVGDDAAFYAVVVHARKVPAAAANTRPVQVASVPDWMSDLGAPRFKDPPFVFPGIPYDTTSTLVFTLLRLRLQIQRGKQVPLPPIHVERVGWTITKLFLATPHTARQGCFALPWLAGSPSPELLAEVDQKVLDSVYVGALKSRAVQFLTPRATLQISQGDPACAAALVDVLPGKPQTRPILIPNATRRDFPIFTNEGMVGCTLQHAHEYCTGKGDPNAFVKALRDAVQGYLQKEM